MIDPRADGRNEAMPRYDLTDEQWHRLRPLLPPQWPPTGRPAHDHRTVINGILFVLRSGCAWRDLPDRYGNWRTVSSRFYRWCKQGVWQRVLEVLRQRAWRERPLGEKAYPYLYLAPPT